MKVMELNDLKSEWKNAGEAFKTEADLLKMTRVANHPSLKKMKRKLIAETIFLVAILFVYYDWFDGDEKPLYANALLVSSLLLYLANDVIGYVSIAKPISGSNLKTSLDNYLARIKRLSVFSLACAFLYGSFLIAFFASAIHFTKEKRWLLAGIIILLFQVLFWSYRVWTKWIKNLHRQVKDFELEENS